MSIECDEAIATMLQPLYPFRLAACASKQTDLPTEMFNQCHKIITLQVTKKLIQHIRDYFSFSFSNIYLTR